VLVVEKKMIVVYESKDSSFSPENRIGIDPSKITEKHGSPLPFDTLTRKILLNTFPARILRLFSRHVADLHCDRLRKHVCQPFEVVAGNLRVFVNDAELNSIFGMNVWRSRRMINKCPH
jgi:hypothetical protein